MFKFVCRGVFHVSLLACLPLVACTPADTSAPLVEDSVVGAGKASHLHRVEDRAHDHLTDPALGLLDGVQAAWTRRVRIDAQGIGHTRVVQTVDNIPVLGGEAIVHIGRQGQFGGMVDGLVRDLEVDTTPLLTGFDAVDLAVDSTVGWGQVSAEPAHDLYVVRMNGRDHLTYRVRIRAFETGRTPSIPVVFIDAHTGEEVLRYDDLHTASGLKDSEKVTYDLNESTVFGDGKVGSSEDTDLLMTHNAVGDTLDFLATLGRDSYDDDGSVVRSYGHYGVNYVNAFWDPDYKVLAFGDGDGSYATYMGVLDITAHELGHGLSASEVGFTYYGESGAISESSSDILAAAVEAFVDGGAQPVKGDLSDTFDIGEDCWLPAPALRYMHRPSDDGSSRDHYSDRYQGSGDSGGVHYNSGIGNHFFYLLSMGGQHHDPKFASGKDVRAIGITKAYNIWYKALTSYMTSSTSFSGARNATEHACEALGYSSLDCDSVSAAWNEVGVL